MKDYLAFYGAVYYPSGGMGDFIGDFHTKEEAIKAIEKMHRKERSYDIKWESAWASVWSSKDRIEVYTK